MFILTPLFEFQARNIRYTKQKALNRAAGMAARKFAPDSMLKQYAQCRARCMKIKEQIQRYKARGMAVARRTVR